ncbi:hypothetical protein KIH75_02210 [Bifidobacterium sp. 64T4]|uniref:hypothetical protein n=1 Tax=Bifidobacterium pongonis TaxID=2834432 RepID=UPI001C564A9C|nr:hypothetical protein [Bifidobacterium pongonis]MBW3094181.1 hypothetical protein [Bifidobacterium pongonis]
MMNIRHRLSHPFRLLLLLIPIANLCSYLVMGDFSHWWVLLPALAQIALLVVAYWYPKVAFYVDRISDLGGVLTSENLDDDWNMYASIPVKATK